MTVQDTKSRLANLKEQLMADPVQLNTDNLFPSVIDFPEKSDVKYVDYLDQLKTTHKEFAEQSINNIVLTYVKSPELLESPRLKDLKQTDILKYTRILLMLNISESNLIRLQESIDGGDMSKEMFDSVNKAQQELRSNMKALDDHLNKCENYWKEYSQIFGFETNEEKIVQATETKDEDKEIKRTVIDMTTLTNIIQDHQDKIKKEDN